MSNCRFCGEPAGLFHHEHPECAEKHENGRREITNIILEGCSPAISAVTTASRVREAAERSFISENERDDLSLTAWSVAVENALDKGVLSEATETRFVDLKEALSLSSGALLQTDAWDRMVKSAVLRDLMNGVIPKRMNFDGELPLNLQKNEQIVWGLEGVDYFEQKTRRQYVGGSTGISVRVMKGVYYHAGAFRGHPVERTELVHTDTGLFAVTTKHIYFSGARKAFRIPYPKIVAFEPFSDGLGVTRDAASAGPQIFVTHDGWFTYNLVTNLARL